MTNQQLGNYKTVDKYEITPLWCSGNYSQPCDYMSNFNCCALVLMSFSDKFLKRIKNLQEKTITIFPNDYGSMYVMRCANWYHFYNLKNMKTGHGGVLLLVKLQASACNFSKGNTFPRAFFTFFNCTNGTKLLKASHVRSSRLDRKKFYERK